MDEPLEVVVEVLPGHLAPGLLGRVLGAVAARCDLPLDRLDDALLVSDALCDQAARLIPEEALRVRVAALQGELWLHIGPMSGEHAAALLAVPAPPGAAGLLATLADSVHSAGVEHSDDIVVALSFAARSG